MAVELERNLKTSVCLCCGRSIKPEYMFCVGCERKRMKVFNDSIGAGLSSVDAWGVVGKVYPVKFKQEDGE
jgi:hypothetical protein